MSGISTHVLDAVLGLPAASIAVRLEQQRGEQWMVVGEGRTDQDGRLRGLWTECDEGSYRLTFDVGAYFHSQDRQSIYSEVVLSFNVKREQHYHLPLLLSDNSYTTYRGS